MYYTYLSNFYVKIKIHMSELQPLTTRFQQPEIRIKDFENEIE